MPDLIDRQAAIDAVSQGMCTGMYCDVLDNIKRLPSAQPEITMKDVEEYCRKRCLIVITNELFHEMRARWSQSQPDHIRCRDCKYAEFKPGATIHCKELSTDLYQWDYCSYAERRTT